MASPQSVKKQAANIEYLLDGQERKAPVGLAVRPGAQKGKRGKPCKQASTLRMKQQKKVNKKLASEFAKTHHREVNKAGDIAVSRNSSGSSPAEFSMAKVSDKTAPTPAAAALTLSPRGQRAKGAFLTAVKKSRAVTDGTTVPSNVISPSMTTPMPMQQSDANGIGHSETPTGAMPMAACGGTTTLGGGGGSSHVVCDKVSGGDVSVPTNGVDDARLGATSGCGGGGGSTPVGADELLERKQKLEALSIGELPKRVIRVPYDDEATEVLKEQEKDRKEREKDRKEREKREKEREKKEKEREREREKERERERREREKREEKESRRKEKERKEKEKERKEKEKEEKKSRGRQKEKDTKTSNPFKRALSPKTRDSHLQPGRAPAILQRHSSFIVSGEPDDPEAPPRANELTKFLLYHMDVCLALLEVYLGDHQQMLCSYILSIFQTNRVEQRLIMFSLQKECLSNHDPATLFRDNTSATQLLSMYCRVKARRFLKQLLKPFLTTVDDNKEAMEVDPNRCLEGDAAENVLKLTKLVDGLLSAIFSSVNEFPSSLKAVFKELQRVVKSKYSDDTLSPKIIGGFFFLRFLCPMLVAPDKYGLQGFCSAGARRSLILVTKIIQNMSNGVVFGKKETFMIPFNDLIERRAEDMQQFLQNISTPPSDSSYYVPRSSNDREEEPPTNKALREIIRSANGQLKRLKEKLEQRDQTESFDTLFAMLKDIESEESLGWRPLSIQKAGPGGEADREEEDDDDDEEEEDFSKEAVHALKASLRQCEEELLETKQRLEEEMQLRQSLQEIVTQLADNIHFLQGQTEDSTRELQSSFRKSVKLLKNGNSRQAIASLSAAVGERSAQERSMGSIGTAEASRPTRADSSSSDMAPAIPRPARADSNNVLPTRPATPPKVATPPVAQPPTQPSQQQQQQQHIQQPTDAKSTSPSKATPIQGPTTTASAPTPPQAASATTTTTPQKEAPGGRGALQTRGAPRGRPTGVIRGAGSPQMVRGGRGMPIRGKPQRGRGAPPRGRGMLVGGPQGASKSVSTLPANPTQHRGGAGGDRGRGRGATDLSKSVA